MLVISLGLASERRKKGEYVFIVVIQFGRITGPVSSPLFFLTQEDACGARVKPERDSQDQI